MNLENPKFVLITIALVFFTPLLLAIMMRSSWWDFEPSGSANRGTLVQPPIALPVTGLDVQYAPSYNTNDVPDQWIMLYPFPGECQQRCQSDVAGLRQIHIAVGRNRARVAVWLLSPGQTSLEVQKKLVSLYPEFNILNDPAGEAADILAATGAPISPSGDFWQSGQAFLLDPATNIILLYTSGFDPNDIKQDLDRLLNWSGKE